MNDDVVKFIKASVQPVSDESAKLYRKLITEEYNEFIDAIIDDDEIEKLDACMDLIWVVLGYCYAKGYKTDAAWAEECEPKVYRAQGDDSGRYGEWGDNGGRRVGGSRS